MHGSISTDWADGTYTFRLALSQIEELEEKCSLSIFEMVERLHPQVRTSRSKMVMETLRLGLIGGGMKPMDALAKVRKYGDERPLDENRDVAYAVALAALMRVHSKELESPPGEGDAAGSNGSTSPRSTETPS